MISRTRIHRTSRRRLRRVASAVLFVLFGSQVTGVLRASCEHIDVRQPAAPMAGMEHAMHGAMPAGSDAVPGAPTRSDVPAPAHNVPCDHSLPAAGCDFGTGCVVAIPGIVTVLAAAHPASQVSFLAPPSGERILEFAPDTPPPRA